MSKRNRVRRGVAIVESALIILLVTSLLMGAIFIGSELIRMLQAVMVTRDVGHMYAREVDFSEPINQTLIAKLAHELAWDSGQGVLILSTIQFISDTECGAISNCNNRNSWVLTHRLTVGALPIKSAYLADPPAARFNPDGTLKNPPPGDPPFYLTDTGLRLTGFTRITPEPATGFNTGTAVYMVESYFKSDPVIGFRDNPYIRTEVFF